MDIGVRGMSEIFNIRVNENLHCNFRHFLKEDLPRIAYANPGVKYQVSKFRQLTLENPWKPTLQLEFGEPRFMSLLPEHPE